VTNTTTDIGTRELQWIHLFLPALTGQRGVMVSHSRPCFFDGKAAPDTGDDGGVQAQLKALR